MKPLALLLLPALLCSLPAPAQDAVGPFRNSLTVDRTPVDRAAPMMKSYAPMLDKVQPAVVTIMTGVDQPRPQRRSLSQDRHSLAW